MLKKKIVFRQFFTSFVMQPYQYNMRFKNRIIFYVFSMRRKYVESSSSNSFNFINQRITSCYQLYNQRIIFKTSSWLQDKSISVFRYSVLTVLVFFPFDIRIKNIRWSAICIRSSMAKFLNGRSVDVLNHVVS